MKNILMKINKLWIAGILFLLSVFAFPELFAEAAVTKEDVYTVYMAELVRVKKNGSDSLYFAFEAAGKTPKNYTPVLPGATFITGLAEGETPVEYFVIDLSAYTFKNETTLYLKYKLEDTPFTITIPAQKELKAAYCGLEPTAGALADFMDADPYANSETGFFSFTLNGTAVPKDKLEHIEWMAGVGGNYSVIEEFNLDMYLVSGATLYFRYNDGDGPISKIAKVKLKKIAKAPSVKLDGSKLTLGLKTGMEYRVSQKGADFTEWYSVPESTSSMSLSKLEGLAGDGLYTNIDDAVIEVRVKATANTHCSASSFVSLKAAEAPVSGADGIVVAPVSPSNVQKGLSVKNNSEYDYQYTVVKKNSWESEGVRDLIEKISGTAKKGEVGNVSWKSVKAGKSTKISYNDVKDNDYVILIRRAVVAEDKNTEEIEYRIASVIRPYGGMKVTPSISSGVFTVKEDETEKEISFDVEPGYELYTAVDAGEFTKNTDKKLIIKATAGKTVTVRAYMKNGDDETEVQTFTYRFVTDGELPDYADAWGYNYMKYLDAKAGNQNNQIIYQRIFLAATQYSASVDVSDLNIPTSFNNWVVVEAVKSDNPVLIQLGHGLGWTYVGTQIKSYTLRLASQSTCETLLEECNANLDIIKANIKEFYGDKPSKIQQVKVIHDFLVQNKQYKDSDYAQTMAGALAKQYTPVCMSYTLALKYCCEKLGIQCEIIYGDAGGSHAWNIINYGERVDYAALLAGKATVNSDEWYEMDVTWDDPVGSSDFYYVGYGYFNVTTAHMEVSRKRELNYYPAYPVDKCTGTALSYDNVKYSLIVGDKKYSWIK